MGNVILGLLLLEPATLYALRKHFESTISLFYSASLGSLGTALATLHDRGLVEVAASVEHGRRKKTYTITAAGRQAFVEWMRAPVVQRDFETVALSKVFFLGLLDESDRAESIARLSERQAADEAVLHGVAEQLESLSVPAHAAEVFYYQKQVLEYGLRTHVVARTFFAELDAGRA